jgi:hypothetical protein
VHTTKDGAKHQPINQSINQYKNGARHQSINQYKNSYIYFPQQVTIL